MGTRAILLPKCLFATETNTEPVELIVRWGKQELANNDKNQWNNCSLVHWYQEDKEETICFLHPGGLGAIRGGFLEGVAIKLKYKA